MFAFLFGKYQMLGWLSGFINFKNKKSNEKETE